MAWLRQRAEQSSTALVPIVGPRTAGQLDDYLRALDVILSPGQFELLSSVSAVALGVPHDACARQLPALAAGVVPPSVPVA
jgi:hypothetical protein